MPSTRTKPNPWKPIRDGEIYCAPACGRGCTHAEYAKAISESDGYAQHLGAGWKTRVFENLGWHWELISPSGRLTVSPHYREKKLESFTASIQMKNGPGFHANDKRPRAAISKVRAKVAQHADAMKALRILLERDA